MITITGIKPSIKGYLRTRRIVLHPIFILMQLCIGVWINYKKKAFEQLNLSFVFFECVVDLIATLILLTGVFSVRKARNFFMGGKITHILLAMLSGILCVFSAQLFFCIGLKYTSGGITAPWMLVTPSVVGLLGMILKYESRKTLKIFGVTISLIGVLSFIGIDFFYEEYISFVGTLSLMIHAIALAVGLLLWRKLLKIYKHPPLVVSTWAVGTGTICMIFAYLSQELWWIVPPDFENDISQSYHIFGVIVTISVAYACNYGILAWATRRSAISVVALYASARPLFTETLSFIISRHYTTIEMIISSILMVMVLCGLLLNSYSKKKEKGSIIRKQYQKTEGKLRTIFSTVVVGFQEPVNTAPLYKRLV
ncbi:unnamed protein product [Blepharisma stoltei]|uniref:EamA domain-containing protein n=1 Tax=Blepharisma stoltei TaxID=1481888 RepID=A0AAU9JGY5_9CILI|nr:unnamed protein product [Blepharisma stoltei]